MWGDTTSTEQVLVLPTHDGVFQDVQAYSTVECVANGMLKAFIFKASFITGHFLFNEVKQSQTICFYEIYILRNIDKDKMSAAVLK